MYVYVYYAELNWVKQTNMATIRCQLLVIFGTHGQEGYGTCLVCVCVCVCVCVSVCYHSSGIITQFLRSK